ncbi:hypothetical protein GCM10010275_55900 [Streptomyces litmocidini]|uniref:hypothetical protein n=1 Tax=Streptomyces litmocidini TaxID=67318 RepID=UPI00167EDCE6|nr:hypothetical protein [Streptomyces litmocidini]GGV08402.1 hypothetical protein GCM10010275_55900 [Streptomyces litmocidini]
MAPKNEHFLRVVRQLRRIRVLYMSGVLLWAAAAAWTGGAHPGSPQMWASLFLLVVFAGLLFTACVWLRRLREAPGHRPAHHAAPRRAVASRHASV